MSEKLLWEQSVLILLRSIKVLQSFNPLKCWLETERAHPWHPYMLHMKKIIFSYTLLLLTVAHS